MRWWHLSFTEHNHINCFSLNGLIFPMCHHFSIWSSRASLLMSVCVRERVRNGDIVCLWASTHHYISLHRCVFACSLGCGLMLLTAVCVTMATVCVCTCLSVGASLKVCFNAVAPPGACQLLCSCRCISRPEALRIYPSSIWHITLLIPKPNQRHPHTVQGLSGQQMLQRSSGFIFL